jgi:hypothetical protein
MTEISHNYENIITPILPQQQQYAPAMLSAWTRFQINVAIGIRRRRRTSIITSLSLSVASADTPQGRDIATYARQISLTHNIIEIRNKAEGSTRGHSHTSLLAARHGDYRWYNAATARTYMESSYRHDAEEFSSINHMILSNHTSAHNFIPRNLI